MLRLALRCAWLSFLGALAALSGQSDETATLNLRARDSRIGLEVKAVVQDARRATIGASAPGESSARVSLAAGRGELEVQAEGYRPLRMPVDLRAGESLELTVWLDPIGTEASPRLAPRPGQALLYGVAYDATSGLPLAGVRVRLEAAGAEASSDSSGAFALEMPAPRESPAAELPATDVLLASRHGYMTTRVAEVLLTGDATRLAVGLIPGEGTHVQGDRHKLRGGPRELAEAQSASSVSEALGVAPPSGARASLLPDTIRVGFDCSCARCASVQAFSLETYVRLGLDDEWVPSWHEEALRAGAVAYRSYGAWHVAHPRAANYDICSTTCCQVIDPLDSTARVDAAVARTAGEALVGAAGEPFLAEYSAENNGESCPDGQVGRPPHGWPCIADPVDAGKTLSGHGRGMCQWGSQRWAIREGRDYRWILDHYYNDNGRPSGRRSGTLRAAAP